MVSPTRRALLHGSVGLATAIAGCSGLLDESTDSTRTATSGVTDDGPVSGSVTDPETLLLRVDTDRPPVWLAQLNNEDTGRPTASDQARLRDSIVVDDSARADRVGVVGTVDRDQVESFFAATDFESETVFVEMSGVEECFQLDLCRISWTPTEISTDYVRRTRSYTERCGVDKQVIEARFIRIPDTIEADNVNSYSSSAGTGACGRRQGGAEGASRADRSSTTESTVRTETTTTDSEGGQR